MNKRLIESTPFDQYSRQYQVAALVNDIRKDNQSFRILDVGGYKGKSNEFFPDDDVWVLDVFNVAEEKYIKGDGTHLPFKDNDFDFVVNFDVLEHIPNAKRKQFIDECNRVASSAIFICAPQNTPDNKQAEQALNNLYKGLHKRDHRWLKEHIEYVLPNFKKIDDILKKEKFYTLMLPSNDTTLWVLMQGVIFLNSKFPMAASKVVQLNTHYNTHFPYDGGVDFKNTYRIILCASKDQGLIERLSNHFGKTNKALSLVQKIKLIEKIHNFQMTLLTKMLAQGNNLKDLYEYELKRANQLYDINLKLHDRIAQLESDKENKNILRRAGKKLQALSPTKKSQK